MVCGVSEVINVVSIDGIKCVVVMLYLVKNCCIVSGLWCVFGLVIISFVFVING